MLIVSGSYQKYQNGLCVISRPTMEGGGGSLLRVRLAVDFRSEKFPRNILGTASVIPRKKVLIPRHSEVYGRVYFEARTGRKWHEKN
jgi:hypothetical protein